MLGKTLPRRLRKQPGDDSARGSTPYPKWAEGIAETRMEQACRPAAHLIRSSRSSQPNQTAQRRAAALSPDDRNESDWRTIARRAFRPGFEKTGLAPSWIDFQPPYLATRCISSALTSGVRPDGLSLWRSSFPAPKPCFETDCSRPISCRSFPTWNRLLESRRPARAIPDLRSQRSLVFDRRFGKAIGTDRSSENLIQVGQSWS